MKRFVIRFLTKTGIYTREDTGRNNQRIVKLQKVKLSFSDCRLHRTNGFYTPPVHIVASERIEGTTRRFPRTESIEPSQPRLQLASAVRRLFPIWQASQTQHFRCQPIIGRIAVIRFARTALLLPSPYLSFFLLFLLRPMSSSFSMSSSSFLFPFSHHFARTLFLYSIFLYSQYLHSFLLLRLRLSFHADHLILRLRFFKRRHSILFEKE